MAKLEAFMLKICQYSKKSESAIIGIISDFKLITINPCANDRGSLYDGFINTCWTILCTHPRLFRKNKCVEFLYISHSNKGH